MDKNRHKEPFERDTDINARQRQRQRERDRERKAERQRQRERERMVNIGSNHELRKQRRVNRREEIMTLLKKVSEEVKYLSWY